MALKKGAHIYFMGLCGVAMSSLAGLFKENHFYVTGSDQHIYPPISDHLERLNIHCFKGFSKENLKEKPDLIVVGNVISSHFEEVLEMKRQKIPYISMAEALSHYFLQGRESVMVCGTHGKTTTSFILVSIFKALEKDFGFLIGGLSKQDHRSYKLPSEKAPYFIVEGDEYDTAFFDKRPKFYHYKPYHVILTSVEFDHADIYKDISDIKNVFKWLCKNIPKKGSFIFNIDDENVEELARASNASIKASYGEHKGDYQLRDLAFFEDRSEFDILYKGAFLSHIQTPLSGRFNALNILSAFALSHQLGFNLSKITEGIRHSYGAKRRQELLGTLSGVTVMEDFAHHPSSVSSVLDSLKKRYPSKKIFCAFEPRSATSRRNIFQQDYLEAFDHKADETIIFKAFSQEKIEEKDRFSSEKLVRELKERGNKASFFSSKTKLIDFLIQKTKKNDLIVLLSNGGFENLYKPLLKALKDRKR